MDNWKLLAITSTCILILILSLTYVFGPSAGKIPLSDHDKERAIAVATKALEKDLPSNYTVGDPVAGLRLAPHRRAGEGEKRVAHVSFRSENFSAWAAVDIDAWNVVMVTESFGWMAEASWRRGWYHESWTRRLNNVQKVSVLGMLSGGIILLYWGFRRKRGEQV